MKACTCRLVFFVCELWVPLIQPASFLLNFNISFVTDCLYDSENADSPPDPPKSTTKANDSRFSFVSESFVDILNTNTQWPLDDCGFLPVAPKCELSCAF